MQTVDADSARLLVVIPCLNEEPYLDSVLTALLADPAATSSSFVVADGGSSDGSVQVVAGLAAADPRVRLVQNTKRLQSAGVNQAVASSAPEFDFIVRVDDHASYPRNYLTLLVAACIETGADSVTVSMRSISRDRSWFQNASAVAQNSLLGTGGAAHRSRGGRKWVDHGHHALFRASTFLEAGGYDESFSHNEDAELDARILKGGGRILLDSSITIDYFPRDSAKALWLQYYNFGKGRARTLHKHPRLPNLRQIVVPCVAPIVLASVTSQMLGSFTTRRIFQIVKLPAVGWLGLCLTAGLGLGVKEGRVSAAFSGVAASIMQLAWSTGFWVGLLRVRNTLR